MLTVNRLLKSLQIAISDLMDLSDSVQTLIALQTGRGPVARLKKAFAERRNWITPNSFDPSTQQVPVNPVVHNISSKSFVPPLPLASAEDDARSAGDVLSSSLSESAKDEVSQVIWGYLVPLDPEYGDKPLVLKRHKPCTESNNSSGEASLGSVGYLIGRHPECGTYISFNLQELVRRSQLMLIYRCRDPR